MSIDDEIRQKKQSMQAAVDAEAKRQADAKRLQDAMRAAGMSSMTPIIRMPSQELQAVITETMPRMTFNAPKIIRNMPDGTTRVRHTQVRQNNKKERADDYSFDVIVKTETIDKSTYTYSIWFFKNGSVAFSKALYGSANDIDNPGVTTREIREKIIETIAGAQIVTPQKSSTSSSSSTTGVSGGCYIATAVYGSYNCPEVWILRRYRDNVLQSKWYGRLFIKAYYAISPRLVERFGETKSFQRFWRTMLDSLTDSLQRKGISNKPYDDR